jgi:menaquinol-cytochrome c reductase iron-sulfur subunit
MAEEIIFRMGIPVLDETRREAGKLEKLVFSETEKKITEIVIRELSCLRRIPVDRIRSVGTHEILLTGQINPEEFPIFDPDQFEELPTWFFPAGYRIEVGSLVTLKPSDIRIFGETEAYTRREFMAKSTAVVATMIGISLVVPIGGYILAAVKTKLSDHWIDLPVRLDQLPLDSPVTHTFSTVSVSGWMRVPIKKTVWLIRHSGVTDPDTLSADASMGLESSLEKNFVDPRLTVFSPICPHLGCAPQWIGDQKQFVCPCHHSVYEITGKVVSGPAPRPMDTFPVRIAPDGTISIIYEQFAIGIPEKVRLA